METINKNENNNNEKETLLQNAVNDILSAFYGAKEYKHDIYEAILPLLRSNKKDLKEIVNLIEKQMSKDDFAEICKYKSDYEWDDPIDGLTPETTTYFVEVFSPSMEKKLDPTHYFSTNLFQCLGANGKPKKLYFEPATLSVIGGRPNAGKTSALVSLAADALRQGKQVTYINCDMDPNEVILKLALSLLAQDYDILTDNPLIEPNYDPLSFADSRQMAETLKAPADFDEWNFSKQALMMGLYKGEIKEKDKSKEPYKQISRMKDVFNELDGYFKNHQFRIFDTRNAEKNWEKFSDAISGLPYGSIAMLDYIQSFEMYPGKEKSEFLDQQRKVVSGVTDLASTSGLVFICAAQLRRDTREENLKLLTQGDFADTSEIEKRANLALGIGRILTQNGPKYYYAHVKDRNTPCGGQFWLEEKGYKYSYVHAKRGEHNALIPTPTEKDWANNTDKTVKNWWDQLRAEAELLDTEEPQQGKGKVKTEFNNKAVSDDDPDLEMF